MFNIFLRLRKKTCWRKAQHIIYRIHKTRSSEVIVVSRLQSGHFQSRQYRYFSVHHSMHIGSWREPLSLLKNSAPWISNGSLKLTAIDLVFVSLHRTKAYIHQHRLLIIRFETQRYTMANKTSAIYVCSTLLKYLDESGGRSVSGKLIYVVY